MILTQALAHSIDMIPLARMAHTRHMVASKVIGSHFTYGSFLENSSHFDFVSLNRD
jgi:hypothetical protein